MRLYNPDISAVFNNAPGDCLIVGDWNLRLERAGQLLRARGRGALPVGVSRERDGGAAVSDGDGVAADAAVQISNVFNAFLDRAPGVFAIDGNAETSV